MTDPKGRDNPEMNADASPDVSPEAVLVCEEWEVLLAEKMDGTMAPGAEAAFAAHSAGCKACAELLEEAEQGRQWLKMLGGQEPAAPVHLLSKILARTQGAGQEADYTAGTSALSIASGRFARQPARWSVPFLPSPHPGMLAARGAHNARLLMTGAMAFFSVALTLSVAGVRLTSVHAAELRPQVVQANVSRSFYGTKKQVVSFYENLRLVYEVESKMREFHGETETPAGSPVSPGLKSPSTPADRGKPAATPKAHGPAAGQGLIEPDRGDRRKEQPVLHGWPVSVSYSSAFSAGCVPSVPAFVYKAAGGKRSGRAGKSAPSQERNRI